METLDHYRGEVDSQGVKRVFRLPPGYPLLPFPGYQDRFRRFNWGYSGTDPALTSLAILWDYFSGLDAQQTLGGWAQRQTLAYFQSFKWQVISCLPEEWILRAEGLRLFLLNEEREREGEEVSWVLYRSLVAERGYLEAVKGAIRVRL